MSIKEVLAAMPSGVVRHHQPTGSRVICDPPPTDTDEDHIVLATNLPAVRAVLLENGWEAGGSQSDEFNEANEPFESFRWGEMNIIATADEAFYRKMSAYTRIAKRLNVMDKTNRIELSQAIRHPGRFYISGLDATELLT